MPDPRESLRQLQEFAQQLRVLNMHRDTWFNAQEWLAKIRPFLRKHYAEYLPDFEQLIAQPTWLEEVGDNWEEKDRKRVTNIKMANGKKTEWGAFLGTLIANIEGDIKEAEAAAKPPVQTPPGADNPRLYLPFRPYKRFKSEIINDVRDVHTRIQMSVFDGQADQMELEGLGGASAVLESIRKHLPDFEPAKAQTANAPEWIRLKPVLVKAGLTVTQETTLSDIKGFLDAAIPAHAMQTEPNEEVAVVDKRNVWVVHGRNQAAADAMFEFLRSLDLKPVEWNEAIHQTGIASPHISDILDAAFTNAQAVVVLLTGDDEVRLRKQFQKSDDGESETRFAPQARPNVLFEAGMAFGRNETRTVLVELGKVKAFSNVAGRNVVKFDGLTISRDNLRQRLITSGCAVNPLGVHWQTSGDFTEALRQASIALSVETQDSESATKEPTPREKELEAEVNRLLAMATPKKTAFDIEREDTIRAHINGMPDIQRSALRQICLMERQTLGQLKEFLLDRHGELKCDDIPNKINKKCPLLIKVAENTWEIAPDKKKIVQAYFDACLPQPKE